MRRFIARHLLALAERLQPDIVGLRPIPELVICVHAQHAQEIGFRNNIMPDRPWVRCWYPGGPQGEILGRDIGRVTIAQDAGYRLNSMDRQAIRERMTTWRGQGYDVWLEF